MTLLGVAAGATYYATTNPEGAEAAAELMADGLEWISDQANKVVEDIRSLAKSTGPKPLTPDEQEKVDHLGEDLDDFIAEHPDLGSEAARKANGEELEYDHVGEAEQYMAGVENDIKHLQNVYGKRNDEAQAAIDRAIAQGQAWLEKMHKILAEEK